jgi:hypothetical protein
MMATKIKKYYGILGDNNPIEHWGGVVYEGQYGPEVTYFQSYEDKVSVYNFQVAEDVTKDLDWVKWENVATYIGMPTSELKAHAKSDNVMARASVYEAVAGYYGFTEIGSWEPVEMSLKAAEKKYGRMVDAAHRSSSGRSSNRRSVSRSKPRSGGRSSSGTVTSRLANKLKRA